MNWLAQIAEDHRGWVILGVLVALLAWESLCPFLPLFRRGSRERLVHGLLNFLLWGINAVMTAVGFTVLWACAARVSEVYHIGLLHAITLPVWMEVVLALLVLDAWTYWWHRLNHRIPFLWRFHQVHHSDSRMDVTTANRFHFGEIGFSSLLRVPVILALGASLWQLALYELLMFPVVQFHHANVALPRGLDRLLKHVIVTPEMHKVHHSRNQCETDSNYSALLSIWDRLFRSLRHRQDPEGIRFGLENCDPADQQTLWGLIKAPTDNDRR